MRILGVWVSTVGFSEGAGRCWQELNPRTRVRLEQARGVRLCCGAYPPQARVRALSLFLSCGPSPCHVFSRTGAAEQRPCGEGGAG